MNKVILTAVFIFIMVNSAFAMDVIQRITYSDGNMVLLCDVRDRVDYCTEQDRQKAAQLNRNPNVYVVEKITIRQQPYDDKFNQKCNKAQGNVLAGTNLLYSAIELARVVRDLTGARW